MTRGFMISLCIGTAGSTQPIGSTLAVSHCSKTAMVRYAERGLVRTVRMCERDANKWPAGTTRFGCREDIIYTTMSE
jgi:hypothetical protein